jgi:hypothetical protein
MFIPTAEQSALSQDSVLLNFGLCGYPAMLVIKLDHNIIVLMRSFAQIV